MIKQVGDSSPEDFGIDERYSFNPYPVPGDPDYKETEEQEESDMKSTEQFTDEPWDMSKEDGGQYEPLQKAPKVPFKEEMPEFPRSTTKPSFEVGVHTLTLCKVGKVIRKKYDFETKRQLDELEEKVAIVFTDGKSEISFEARPILFNKSSLYKFSKKLDSGLFTPEVMSDPAKFWVVLNSLKGRKYMVHVSVNEKQTWSKIESVMPVPTKG